jgi:hypothetical protein
MFTKKLTDLFSADLLETVSGILGEAKKCKECGCAKCECEDEGEEDDMEDAKEGYVPTADEPTEANKKTADKVRALLAKEKKPVKEEIDDALEAELKAQRQTKKSVADAKKKYGVKEEVELEEGITSMSDARLKFHATKKFPHGSYTSKQIEDEHQRRRKTVANYHTVKPSLGEEAEQIDELSKKTLGSYVKKAAGNVGAEALTAGLKIKSGENPMKNLNKTLKRQKGIETATNKLTKEEQEFIDSLNKELFDEIEITEARGRPKKAGGKDFTIHPKTKEKLMHNNPEHMKKIELLQKNKVLEKPKTEAGQHIINQLQKAKTSMTGGTKIHFTHGDSKEVSGAHAAKLLDKYAGMKPNEKEDFQKKIGHSHEQLMKHV